MHTQVVVAPHSHIIGKSIRELKFRTKYDAAIVAVQRRVRASQFFFSGLVSIDHLAVLVCLLPPARFVTRSFPFLSHRVSA